MLFVKYCSLIKFVLEFVIKILYYIRKIRSICFVESIVNFSIIKS